MSNWIEFEETHYCNVCENNVRIATLYWEENDFRICIYPECKGGGIEYANLRVLCKSCNGSKGGK